MLPRAVAIGLIVLAAPALRAQTADDGLHAGPWVVAPYLVANYEFNDNVLLRNDENAQSDRVRNTLLGVVSTLLFSNSDLRLGYEGNRRVYEKRRAEHNVSHDFDAELNLRFGNGSRFQIAERHSRGNSDVETLDDSGERTFDGEPFDANTWALEFSREIPRMRGFRVGVSGDRLRNRGTDIPFFDYDRLQAVAEYREPIGPRMWFTATVEGRRADHFEPDTGNLIREEQRDSLRLGFRGLDPGGQPFYVSLGAERFSYEGRDATEYTGLSAQAQWQLSISRDSQFRVSASRRALPSFFRTYYVVHDLNVGFDRRLFLRSKAGISLRWSRNRYGAPVDLNDDNIPEEDFRRSDTFKRGETFLEFEPSPRIGFRVGLRYWKRESNYADVDYENVIVTTSVLLGWRP